MSSDGARRRRSGGVKGRSSSFYEGQHRQPGTASYFQDTGSGGRRPPFRDTNEPGRGRQRSKSSQRYQHQHHSDSRGAQFSGWNNRRSRSCDPYAYSNRDPHAYSNRSPHAYDDSNVKDSGGRTVMLEGGSTKKPEEIVTGQEGRKSCKGRGIRRGNGE